MKRVFGVFLLLGLLLILPSCALGEDPNAKGKIKEIQVDAIEELGDLIEQKPEVDSVMQVDNTLYYAFQSGEEFYCAVLDCEGADMETFWSKWGTDKNPWERISSLKVDELVNMTSQVIPQEELDTYIGKKGKDLFDEGWYEWTSFYANPVGILLGKGPFSYCLTFVEPITYRADMNITQEVQDKTIATIQFWAFADLTMGIDGE